MVGLCRSARSSKVEGFFCVAAPGPDSALKTYPTLATFACRLIKIYFVRYYIIFNMCCINFFPQFLPLPTIIPLEHDVITIDNFLIVYLI